MIAQHVNTMREDLLRMNWESRADPNFISNFLKKAFSYRTVIVTKGANNIVQHL